jgi:hypothetical protein
MKRNAVPPPAHSPATENGNFVLAMLFALALLSPGVQAQTFSVIHTFTGGRDGGVPYAGLTRDSVSLYGTTSRGGIPGGCDGAGCGTVYKLVSRTSSWVLISLYTFSGSADGGVPLARVVFGPNGGLFGTTAAGGSAYGSEGAGTVFSLQPPGHTGGNLMQPWTEKVLHQFGGPAEDGNYPYFGDLVFDPAGDIYGTTYGGGFQCGDATYCGTVFQLKPSGNRIQWNENILYEFTDLSVAVPQSGVVLDPFGNLYGTTSNGLGAAYKLSSSGSEWTETTIHQFGSQGDGSMPVAGLAADGRGNYIGATQAGGANGVGAVFELVPNGGGWSESVIYNLTGGGSPEGTLFRDPSGNMYGTACQGGTHNAGLVFKLTYSGGTWTERDLYNFTGGDDGYCPIGEVVVDADGNVFGTTIAGGAYQNGVVWKIAP